VAIWGKLLSREWYIYGTWVVVKSNGVVLRRHCTCMAGFSKLFNHVGILYKWQEAPQECLSTSLPKKWLPATNL